MNWMYGFKKNGVSIVACNMPYRKKACLCIQRKNSICKYATFNNDTSAKVFMDILADFIGAEKINWEG